MSLKKLLSKLNNVHFLSLAGNGLAQVLGILTVIALIRWLSPEKYGVWVFFQAVFVLLDTFRTGFLQTALIKFFAGADKERSEQVAGTTWYLGFIITAISFVVTVPALLLKDYINSEDIFMALKWFSISFLSTLPICMATWIQQANMRFDRILFIRLINQGSFILLVFYLILTNNKNIEYVFITNLISCVLTSIIVLLCGWTHISYITKKTSYWTKEIFHFGKYSVGTTISANLLRSSDTFIIRFMLGPAAVAIYSLAQKLMEFIEFPLRSFVATGVPALSTAYNQNKKDVGALMQKYAGMLTIILIPVALGGILFADTAIYLIGGKQYVQTEAANIFRIFMCFAILFPIDRFIGVTLDVMHQPKANFIKVLLMLSVNVVCDFIGVYLLNNVYGIALASIPTFLVGVLYGYNALKKHIGFTLPGIFKYGYSECYLLFKMYFLKSKVV